MSNTAPEQTVLPHAGEELPGGSLDLIAVAIAMIAEWRTALVTFVIVSAICVGYVFTLKPQYVATATFLPQEGHSQADAFASIFSMRGPGGLYIGLLRSRSVQDDMIARLNLKKLWNISSSESARDQLAGKSSFAESPDGIVTISIRDSSAQEAATIANGYLEALGALDRRMGADQTRRTREFFEAELADEEAKLNKADAELEATQRKTGILQPEAQTGMGLSAIAGLRGQITNLQVQLAALLQSETESNPQVKAIRASIAQLQVEETEMEQGGKNPLGVAPATEKLPASNLDFTRASREVRYHDALVNSLANQFENAHLSEDAARSAFQEIDAATIPEHKAWPPRKPYILISLVFGLFMGFLAIVARLVGRRIMKDPKHRENMQALRAAFSLR